MPDWKDKLEDQFRQKREKEQAELKRRSVHDEFISAHAFNAWQELVAKLGDACQHLSSHANANLTLMRGAVDDLTVAGGTKPLDVSFDLLTKMVKWELRETHDRGTLKPDRRGDELVYKITGGQTFSVEDAAAFLIQKVF